jgi:hypothetical protein
MHGSVSDTRHSMHASKVQMRLFAQTHSALHIHSVVHANITQYLVPFSPYDAVSPNVTNNSNTSILMYFNIINQTQKPDRHAQHLLTSLLDTLCYLFRSSRDYYLTLAQFKNLTTQVQCAEVLQYARNLSQFCNT